MVSEINILWELGYSNASLVEGVFMGPQKIQGSFTCQVALRFTLLVDVVVVVGYTDGGICPKKFSLIVGGHVSPLFFIGRDFFVVVFT